MEKDLVRKLENNCRLMPAIIAVASIGVSVFFLYNSKNIIKEGMESFAILIVIILFCILISAISIYCCIFQRKLSIKKLTKKQQELYYNEIKNGNVKLYTVKGKYVALTESFVVEDNGGILFSHPIVFAFENLLSIITYIYYDPMTRTEYMTARYVDSDFKRLGSSAIYSIEDGKEIISYIKNKAPWIEIIQGEEGLRQFQKLVSSKKGKQEYINKIEKIKTDMIK